MSSISSLSQYSTLSYASQLFNKVNASGTSTEDTTQTNAYDATTTKDSESASSSETKRHSQTSSLDDTTLSALIQSMNGSSSTSSGTTETEDTVSALDTDGDGIISQEEFVAARPDDVTEEMATNLWNSYDTEGAGSLTTEELQTAMASDRPHGPPPPPPEEDDDDDEESWLSSTDSTSSSDSLASILSQLLEEASGTSSTSESSSEDSLSEMISAMDADGDGTITQDEFVAARPDDVTEEMATNLWNSFDTEGAGSLSTSALQTAMADNAPPMNGGVQTASSSTSAYQALLDQLTSRSDSSNTSTTESTSSTDTTSQSTALQAFLEAVQAYDTSAGYAATKDVLSSLLALA